MTGSQPMHLRTLLGDYPATLPLKRGEVSSPHVAFDFADVKVPHTAFRRTVRALEFDVSELSIVTYLIALAHGKPLVLMPVVVMARFQYPYIAYNPARRALTPDNLAGCRIGVRAYAVTTVAWVRGILVKEYGLDIASVRWITCEDSHVEEFRDPPNAERAAQGSDLTRMLLDGEIDAAILGEPPADPRLKTLFPDPAAAAQDWYRRHGAIHINHMMVASTALSRNHPQAVREVYRMFVESKRVAGLPAAAGIDFNPLGMRDVRRGLEAAIDHVYVQRLIPRRFEVDELFDDVTRALGA